jgi:signal transduction histidine kinase
MPDNGPAGGPGPAPERRDAASPRGGPADQERGPEQGGPPAPGLPAPSPGVPDPDLPAWGAPDPDPPPPGPPVGERSPTLDREGSAIHTPPTPAGGRGAAHSPGRGGRRSPPGGPWSGRPRGGPWSGGRPPWWPEGEPFPPAWRGGPRGRFPRRVGLLVALALGLTFLASGIAWRLLGGGQVGPGGGGGGRGWYGPPFPLLILVLLGVAFVGGRVVRRMAAPIGDVMEAADRVAGGDYSTRVQVRGSGEVARLTHSFNQMTERLQANEAQRRALLADVAHELRTPLSVIRGNVEGMLDGVYPADGTHLGPLLEETAVMARLLDDLQTLSTAEAGVLRLHRERVDPLALAQDTAAALRPRADRAGVGLEVRSTDPVPEVDVDQVRIGEVLANLLTNAIRHTPRGGAVRIVVSPAPAGVAFAVSDTGPGIDARDLPHVFDRFVKSADSGGAGLGLAIARSLVEAHGGRITAESAPGAGTTMRFVLPAVGNSTGSSG